MPVKKDGRRSLSEVSGAPSPSQTVTRDIGFCECNTRSAKRNAVVSPRTPVRFPIRTSDAAAWAIVTLVVGVILIAICVLFTLGAPS